MQLTLVRTIGLLVTALAVAFPYAGELMAQESFSFGPPLRENLVFHYKLVERVTAHRYDGTGSLLDSNERIMTYWVSQRQIPADREGAVKIEAYVDSMALEYRGTPNDVAFNTQNMADAADRSKVTHRAVLVPSVVVSTVAWFTLSPYGTLLEVSSPELAKLPGQAESPLIEEYTRKEITQVIDDYYLTTIYFPWRNALPLGRTVRLGDTVRIPYATTIDRIVFRDSADVTVVETAEEDHALRYRAALATPRNEWINYPGHEYPILLDSADARVAGEYLIDPDGVVSTGWGTGSGTAWGRSMGRAYRLEYTHQVFVERLGMERFAIE